MNEWIKTISSNFSGKVCDSQENTVHYSRLHAIRVSQGNVPQQRDIFKCWRGNRNRLEPGLTQVNVIIVSYSRADINWSEIIQKSM